MGNIGFKTRPTRMLQIVHGSDLTSGNKQTKAYNVGSDEIFSGEPIYATAKTVAGGSPEFTWSKTAGANKTVYFAFTDSRSFDVEACGKLLGISSLDTYELQTPFFDATQQYAAGDALTVKLGNLCKGADGFIVVAQGADGDAESAPANYEVIKANVNCLTKAGTADAVCGIVTEGVIELQGNVPVSAAASITGGASMGLDGYAVVGTDGKGVDTVVQGGPLLWTEASGSKYVLQFATKA